MERRSREITGSAPERALTPIAVTVKEAARLLGTNDKQIRRGIHARETEIQITPRTFTIEQACAYFPGINHQQIRKLIWARKVKAIRIGKRWLVDRRSLDQWFDREAG
jgi:excisionase family DNA binding protein